ncbi:GNAT family N-acetyltransferase [Dyella flava]|uniref:GNAT family N-acetyltransferase n=1 Tax=Dyella flava TaxID=1920170 RepID=A0ABS2K182_9GAMM|nr:GNAT family N-acetyltransferase [Dyella flava]MBM7124997.1 GNAT family N-acetyltransferase [Dyella flava]GLQ49953.1 hypothetical protein GCM10010872_14020 [Dyella flava]
MYTVKPYAPADAQAWDALVGQSRNGNFLHRRSYMDYHADRFVDQSLLIERDGKPEAVFPANRKDGVVVSHGGLTYAGLITTQDVRAEATLAVFEQISEHYRAQGVRRIVYKAIPHIFHAYPAEEDLYALHRLGATLTRRDISSVVPLREAFRFADGRKRSISKAKKAGVQIRTGVDLTAFHALLTEVLHKHEVVPTHSPQELRLLQSRFPDHIVLHEAYVEDTLLAGVLVYDFGRTVHTQYMAASEQGRELNALSLLLGELIGHRYADRIYFSFGVSTEQEGRYLNGGLIMQKERFGARAVVHDFYQWEL